MAITTLSNIQDLLQRKQPLTLFGLTLMLGALYLTWGPGMLSADLVAKTIGVAALFLIATSFAAVSLAGYLNRKSLTLSFYPPSERSTSQSSQRCVLELQRGYLLPLCNLSARLIYEHKLETTMHDLRGFGRIDTKLIEEIVFPHRGEWKVSFVEVRVGDLFGICSLKWRQALSSSASARIFPPLTSLEQAPVVTSSFREGDATISEDVRIGDPYDLKQYHPSDGLRKILWKIYAKSGELIARHPEPSMTPEGLLYSFAFCERQDDELASSVVAYLTLIESMNITLRFGCSGMSGSKDSGSIAHDSSEAESLLIESVWSTIESSAAEPSADLDYFLREAARESSGAAPLQILLFVSTRSFASKERCERIMLAGATLERRGIKPIFYLFDLSSKLSGGHSVSDSIRSFFVESAPVEPIATQSQINKFLGDCSRAQWDVIV